MKKRPLVFLIIFSILVYGCAQQNAVQEEAIEMEEQQTEETKKPAEITEEAVQKEEQIPEPEPVVEEAMEEYSFEDTKCKRVFSPKFSAEPYYNGPLFDAHFHTPNLIDVSKIGGHGEGHGFDPITDPVLGRDVELDKILCNFEKEQVRGAIGFAIGAEQLLEETLEKAESIKKDSSGKIKLFLMPIMFETETLNDIQEENPDLFEGYGEIAFYQEELKNKNPDDKEFLDVYKVAEKYNLIVMIHPDGRQESQVENAVRENPNVEFLLHGPEIEGSIVNLMNKYPNVYYSVDAVLARIPPMPASFMYTVSGKEEFLSKFPQNFDLMLGESEKSWKTKIEQHPDRFMWGTDRGHKWTYDEEVSVLLEEFGRAFIARLDPEVQEKFAYENAINLLGTP